MFTNREWGGIWESKIYHWRKKRPYKDMGRDLGGAHLSACARKDFAQVASSFLCPSRLSWATTVTSTEFPLPLSFLMFSPVWLSAEEYDGSSDAEPFRDTIPLHAMQITPELYEVFSLLLSKSLFPLWNSWAFWSLLGLMPSGLIAQSISCFVVWYKYESYSANSWGHTLQLSLSPTPCIPAGSLYIGLHCGLPSKRRLLPLAPPWQPFLCNLGPIGKGC